MVLLYVFLQLFLYLCIERRPRDFFLSIKKVTVFVSFKIKNFRHQGCLICKISAAEKCRRADFRLHLGQNNACVSIFSCPFVHVHIVSNLNIWLSDERSDHQITRTLAAAEQLGSFWKVYDLVWTPGLLGFPAYAFPPIRCSNKHSFC